MAQSYQRQRVGESVGTPSGVVFLRLFFLFKVSIQSHGLQHCILIQVCHYKLFSFIALLLHCSPHSLSPLSGLPPTPGCSSTFLSHRFYCFFYFIPPIRALLSFFAIQNLFFFFILFQVISFFSSWEIFFSIRVIFIVSHRIVLKFLVLY